MRHRRLEHCRADLMAAAFGGVSVARIGARWGFPDAAVFSRTFKAAYGLPPGEFRRRAFTGSGFVLA
ncbi:helix-turn-helix domain-containing protein [Kitasatospora sp. NPDC051170]|uniref:helix-turn-helix domain-containing protein n=1 Tax=Kitasatospora sp. NPDC051170 TaxID=3364056 RepID=UPI0037B4A0AF